MGESGQMRAQLIDVEVALGAVEGLLLFGGVLRDAVGEAYLDLLGAMAAPGAGPALRTGAANFFALLAEAAADGLSGPGDSWQRLLADRIVHDENPFSRAAQRLALTDVPAGLWEAAERDLASLQILLRFDGRKLAAAMASLDHGVVWPNLDDLGPALGDDPLVAQLIDGDDPLPSLAKRYRAAGVGRFARYRAFRWDRRSSNHLAPIRRPDPVRFADLIGYADQRRTVRRNTEHFLRGLPANNLLLYGERGTGKSSTVKALLNEYAGEGLRLVEVAKSSLGDFSSIVNELADRPQRFIVFVDDLSFDENEGGYTELKAILEGGVEIRPDNALIYATSNRRHLVLERFSDRAAPSDEVRAQDTLQEKLSLADRFGVTVIFSTPDQNQYLEIVEGIARQRGLAVDLERLRRGALQWASWNNGRSGRTARQYVDDLTAELRTPR